MQEKPLPAARISESGRRTLLIFLPTLSQVPLSARYLTSYSTLRVWDWDSRL